MELSTYRQVFAEEIEAIANLTTAALVDALAAIPREQFLGDGPWIVRSEHDIGASARSTPDADPRRVYHNYSIAIDPARQLFNGAPGLLAALIDCLALRPGHRVLHIGTGTGYYTALIAHVVGRGGRVLGIEVDEGLAARARRNLQDRPDVEIRAGDGAGPFDETFDAILVNAGVTHPLRAWLEALADRGRLVLPLTFTAPGMTTIGKGVQVLLTRADRAGFDARATGFVVIYSALGLRDDGMNQRIGEALRRSPYPRLQRLRTDPHAPSAACWLHGDEWCLTTEG